VELELLAAYWWSGKTEMVYTYAVILNGIIVNTILASPSDYFDPQYTYVIITNYNPLPGVGWTTSDNMNFIIPVGNN
jgi:hypothetical protein